MTNRADGEFSPHLMVVLSLRIFSEFNRVASDRSLRETTGHFPDKPGLASRMTIDHDVIVASMSDDPATIRECAAEFAPCARADVCAINTAVAAEDAEAVRHMSHRLKGSAALFGAYELQRTCGDLESAAKEPNWTTIRILAPRLAPLLAEVELAIDAFVKQLSAA
jgi:HPt (histidine-containing phosphotransfer) domain-containing protein